MENTYGARGLGTSYMKTFARAAFVYTRYLALHQNHSELQLPSTATFHLLRLMHFGDRKQYRPWLFGFARSVLALLMPFSNFGAGLVLDADTKCTENECSTAENIYSHVDHAEKLGGCSYGICDDLRALLLGMDARKPVSATFLLATG